MEKKKIELDFIKWLMIFNAGVVLTMINVLIAKNIEIEFMRSTVTSLICLSTSFLLGFLYLLVHYCIEKIPVKYRVLFYSVFLGTSVFFLLGVINFLSFVISIFFGYSGKVVVFFKVFYVVASLLVGFAFGVLHEKGIRLIKNNLSNKE